MRKARWTLANLCVRHGACNTNMRTFDTRDFTGMPACEQHVSRKAQRIREVHRGHDVADRQHYQFPGSVDVDSRRLRNCAHLSIQRDVERTDCERRGHTIADHKRRGSAQEQVAGTGRV